MPSFINVTLQFNSNCYYSGMHQTTNTYLVGYLGIILIYGILIRIGLQCVLSLTYRSASFLHDRMLNVVLTAKASFFDMTPSGRVLNRYQRIFN